jgi:hypothetical protein
MFALYAKSLASDTDLPASTYQAVALRVNAQGTHTHPQVSTALNVWKKFNPFSTFLN